jgi:hypothetical protein
MCVSLISERTYYEYSVWVLKPDMTPVLPVFLRQDVVRSKSEPFSLQAQEHRAARFIHVLHRRFEDSVRAWGVLFLVILFASVLVCGRSDLIAHEDRLVCHQ